MNFSGALRAMLMLLGGHLGVQADCSCSPIFNPIQTPTGTCYCVTNQNSNYLRSWADAIGDCHSALGADWDLATFDTITENYDLASRLPVNSSIWLGLSDGQSESTWVWRSGDVANSNFLNFAPGKPDGGSAKNCGLMLPSSQWTDEFCNSTHGFICQDYTSGVAGKDVHWISNDPLLIGGSVEKQRTSIDCVLVTLDPVSFPIGDQRTYLVIECTSLSQGRNAVLLTKTSLRPTAASGEQSGPLLTTPQIYLLVVLVCLAVAATALLLYCCLCRRSRAKVGRPKTPSQPPRSRPPSYDHQRPPADDPLSPTPKRPHPPPLPRRFAPPSRNNPPDPLPQPAPKPPPSPHTSAPKPVYLSRERPETPSPRIATPPRRPSPVPDTFEYSLAQV